MVDYSRNIKLSDSNGTAYNINLHSNIIRYSIQDPSLRFSSFLKIFECIIGLSNITIIIDDEGSSLPFLVQLDKIFQHKVYTNLFTPFDNSLHPIGFNEEFDFPEKYKKSLVYEFLHFIVFLNDLTFPKAQFFDILDKLEREHKISSVSSFLKKLSQYRGIKEFYNINKSKTEKLIRFFAKQNTIYDILEGSLSQKSLYPFLFFYFRDSDLIHYFIHIFIHSLNVLIKRKWMPKDLLINIVLNLKNDDITRKILASDLFNNHAILLNLLDTGIEAEELSRNHLNQKPLSISILGPEAKERSILNIRSADINIEVPIAACPDLDPHKYKYEQITDYFRKKKKIQRSSSMVIYKTETEKFHQKPYADNAGHPENKTEPISSLITLQDLNMKDEYFYPYLGSSISIEYSQNPANIKFSKKSNIIFKYFLINKGIKIEYYDNFQLDEIITASIEKDRIKPAIISLENDDITYKLRNEIRAFILNNESINIHYNRHIPLFSEKDQEYGEFIAVLKRSILNIFDKDIWKIKQKFRDKMSLHQSNLLKADPGLSLKDFLENHYVRHFLFSRDIDYPENLSLSSPSRHSDLESPLRYDIKVFEEELLEVLLELKDKMDRTLNDTISYPVKPDINKILIEDIKFIYLPIKYERNYEMI